MREPYHPGAGPTAGPVTGPTAAAQAAGPVPRQHPLLRPLPVAALGLILLLVCCGGGALLLAWPSSQVPARVAHSTPTRSPTPTPVTPETYLQALATSDTALASAFEQVSSATTTTDLTTSAKIARAVVDRESDTLDAITPPPAAATAHQQLLDALTEMKDELDNIDVERQDGWPCTGSAAVAFLAHSASADLLRQATVALQTADAQHPYAFGAFLPAAEPFADRRLGTGTFVSRSVRGGSGRLKVVNDDEYDAAVTLTAVSMTTPSLTVYVRAKGSYTVTGIPDGSYDSYVTMGKDWDSGIRRFTRYCQFSKFETPSEFTTTRSTYTIWTITLGVSDGTGTPATPVDPAFFPAL